jgi:predicted nucleotidyltransferase component of viral defense system
MENTVVLHNNRELFEKAIKETADSLNTRDFFVEKDYWISLVLKHLAKSKYIGAVVFKGGTSLSKGYKLINRFSEDVDIAVINALEMSGNQLKTLIRSIEKSITTDLIEIDTPGVTSKGSMFRKSVYRYPTIGNFKRAQVISDKLIIEINSFANPYPFEKVNIQSMLGEYLEANGSIELISKYGLEPFELNVLDKKRTLIEKIVSLIRFSFD